MLALTQLRLVLMTKRQNIVVFKKICCRKSLQILHLALCTKTQYHTVGKPYLHLISTKTSNSSHILQDNMTHCLLINHANKKPTCHLKNFTIPQKNKTSKYLQYIYIKWLLNFTCPKPSSKTIELLEACSTTWNTTFQMPPITVTVTNKDEFSVNST